MPKTSTATTSSPSVPEESDYGTPRSDHELPSSTQIDSCGAPAELPTSLRVDAIPPVTQVPSPHPAVGPTSGVQTATSQQGLFSSSGPAVLTHLSPKLEYHTDLNQDPDPLTDLEQASGSLQEVISLLSKDVSESKMTQAHNKLKEVLLLAQKSLATLDAGAKTQKQVSLSSSDSTIPRAPLQPIASSGSDEDSSESDDDDKAEPPTTTTGLLAFVKDLKKQKKQADLGNWRFFDDYTSYYYRGDRDHDLDLEPKARPGSSQGNRI